MQNLLSNPENIGIKADLLINLCHLDRHDFILIMPVSLSLYGGKIIVMGMLRGLRLEADLLIVFVFVLSVQWWGSEIF